MVQIPISSVPNQTFTVLLNQQNCTINLNTRGDFLYCDIYIGTTPVILGVKCTQWAVIPYEYLYNMLGGNLYFINNGSNKDAYPNYTLFNVTQNLVFLTQAEINANTQQPD